MTTPHQVNQPVDMRIDTADLTLYVKIPTLRRGQWVEAPILTVIQVAVRRGKWLKGLDEAFRYLNGQDDE